MSMIRTRWAALGAAVAITLGGGGIGLVGATAGSDELPVFRPITPCRLLDTRPAFQVGPRDTPLGAAEAHTVTAQGTAGDCTIPSDAVALSMNVTAVAATLPTFLTIWATGEPMPDASSLNPVPGQPATPNAVVTELSAGGEFDVYNLQGTVHVIADVNGYYADHDHDGRYVLARDGYVRLSAYDMFPTEAGSGWTFDGGWTHETTDPESVAGRVDLPVGAEVTAVTVVYAAESGPAALQVSLGPSHATAGSTLTGIPPVASFNGVAPQTAAFELAALSIPLGTATGVLEDYDYVLSVHTASDAVTIVGVDVAID